MTDNRTTELKTLSKLKIAGRLRYLHGTIEIPETELHAICDEIQAEHDQAIAATLGSGTCMVESKIFIEGDYVPSPYYEYQMSCGGGFRWDEVEPPTHCPNCGRKVKR